MGYVSMILNRKSSSEFHFLLAHDAFFPINGFIPNNGYYDMLFNTSNLITANTPYLANQLIKIGCLENKIVIVPVGVDTSFFKPTPEELFSKEKLKIITVGRLDSGKGHVYGIEIIRRLVSDGIPVQFNIVGEGKEFQKLQMDMMQQEMPGMMQMRRGNN